MKTSGQQSDLEIGHGIGTDRRKKLGVNHISRSQISDLQTSIKLIKQHKENSIY